MSETTAARKRRNVLGSGETKYITRPSSVGIRNTASGLSADNSGRNIPYAIR